jgi:hypothetical protein
MNHAPRQLFRRLLVAFGLVAMSSVLTHSIANAASDPLFGIPATYKDYQEFPACSATVSSLCIVSFGIDLNNDGVFETPAENLGIKFNAWLFSIKGWNTPGLSYEIRVNGDQELSPIVPAGTAATFAINTGAFKPSPSLFTGADISLFDVNQVDGNWITTGTWKTAGYTFALESSDNGVIEYNKSKKDYTSVAQGVQFYEEPNTLLESKKGMWVSTNASTTGEIQFNAATMTWNVDLGGPARKVDGSVNALRYSTFLPDTFIQYAYGTTPDVLSTALTMTRTDMDVTTKVDATITRIDGPVPGLIINLPDIRLYGVVVSKKSVHAMGSNYSASPKIRIAPKTPLLRAPSILKVSRRSSTTARVVGRSVYGATSYQAMCSQGLVNQFAKAKGPTITVKGLTAGKWNCKIRGAKKLGGRWSSKMSVVIK